MTYTYINTMCISIYIYTHIYIYISFNTVYWVDSWPLNGSNDTTQENNMASCRWNLVPKALKASSISGMWSLFASWLSCAVSKHILITIWRESSPIFRRSHLSHPGCTPKSLPWFWNRSSRAMTQRCSSGLCKVCPLAFCMPSAFPWSLDRVSASSRRGTWNLNDYFDGMFSSLWKIIEFKPPNQTIISRHTTTVFSLLAPVICCSALHTPTWEVNPLKDLRNRKPAKTAVLQPGWLVVYVSFPIPTFDDEDDASWPPASWNVTFSAKHVWKTRARHSDDSKFFQTRKSRQCPWISLNPLLTCC